MLLSNFIKEHAEDDLNRLLLCAARYPDVDVPFAVEQIAARRQVRDKLPAWCACDEVIFPSRIAAEQCSSEQAALYKQQLIKETDCLCDLTGGLGVDSFFFSQKARKVVYIERLANYCEAARHNFKVLGAANIEVRNGDTTATPDIWAEDEVDVFYVDPARRGEGNKRVFALHDCEPDLTALLPVLLRYAPKVIAKLSPMADIQRTLALLPGTAEVHVVSVKNECKELLFVIHAGGKCEHPQIICINYTADGREERFITDLQQEKETVAIHTNQLQAYLYEPNASLLKAGAFKSVTRLGVSKLHPSSHLYTSARRLDTFSGRIFCVEEVLPFSNRLCKTLARSIPQANITVRNFPLRVEELRKKTKIQDGGDVYLFATTLADEQKVLIKCRKADGGIRQTAESSTGQ